MQMPVMIICTPNPWDVSKIRREKISDQLVSYLTYLLNPFGMNPILHKDGDRLEKLEKQFHGTVSFHAYLGKLPAAVLYEYIY